MRIFFDELKTRIDAGQVTWDCNHETRMKDSFHKFPDIFLDEIEGQMYNGYDEALGLNILWDKCDCCGAFIHYVFQNDQFIAKEKTCFERTAFTVDVDVPTGTFMFTDVLMNQKEMLLYLDEQVGSLRSVKSIKLRTELYASERNVMRVYVGNCTPKILQHESGISIGRDGFTEEDEEISFDQGRNIGLVHANQWWVTAVDYAIYEQLAIQHFGEEEGKRMAQEAMKDANVVAQLKPGRYRCHYFWLSDTTPELIARMERIGDINV